MVGADLENGLLRIDLERAVPGGKKPRRIAVGGPKQIEGQGQLPDESDGGAGDGAPPWCAEHD